MNNAFGYPRTAVILGGNSDIAHATITALIPHGLESVLLATRSVAALENRLKVQPLAVSNIHIAQWDANDHTAHQQLFQNAQELIGDIDLVLCAVGTLGHASGLEAEPDQIAELLRNNFTGPATALHEAARHLINQGHGTLIVLGSVAGLRPRSSNFVYGAAKAGLDAYTRGLQDATRDTPIRIHLIRPGFVRTKMTAGLRPAPFAVTVDEVAAAIANACVGQRRTTHHVPFLLGPFFGVFAFLPRRLWQRLCAITDS